MALERLLDLSPNTLDPDQLYTRIEFPDPPEDRPYLYINMVGTVDGKIVLGEVGGSAMGVGGPTDQLLFRRLQRTCDAAMLGAGTLRASQVIYPADLPRFVVSRSGNVPLQNRFFTDAPESAFVIVPNDLPSDVKKTLQASAHLIQAGSGDVDLKEALRVMRQTHAIRHLLCEGGPSLNDDLICAGLADELFLTITPKLKGGSHLPTIVDGTAFPVGQYLPVNLISLYRDENEIYLRYRLGSAPQSIKS